MTGETDWTPIAVGMGGASAALLMVWRGIKVLRSATLTAGDVNAEVIAQLRLELAQERARVEVLSRELREAEALAARLAQRVQRLEAALIAAGVVLPEELEP